MPKLDMLYSWGIHVFPKNIENSILDIVVTTTQIITSRHSSHSLIIHQFGLLTRYIKVSYINQGTSQIEDNMISDIATKKLLITTLASIPDTADTSVLDALSNMRALATPVADKLALRLQKRDDQKMVYDYGYHFGPSPVEMINIRNANIRKLNGEGLKARMDELAKTWTPEQQAARIQEELDAVATTAAYNELIKQNDIKADQKKAALTAWFADFCKTIDAKMLYVVSNIPGYVAPIVNVPVTKKTTPTQGQVQVTLARR